MVSFEKWMRKYASKLMGEKEIQNTMALVKNASKWVETDFQEISAGRYNAKTYTKLRDRISRAAYPEDADRQVVSNTKAALRVYSEYLEFCEKVCSLSDRDDVYSPEWFASAAKQKSYVQLD